MKPAEQVIRRVAREEHRRLSGGDGAVFPGERWECTPYLSEVIDAVRDRLDRRVARHTVGHVIAREKLPIRGG